MKALEENQRSRDQETWEEASGLLDFLKKVHSEVAKFEETFGFGVKYNPAPPSEIDGTPENLGIVGFVITRDNSIFAGRTYCLYSLLKEKTLYGFIGRYTEGKITTLRELRPLEDFPKGIPRLYEWLRELVKSSCEKI